jgi:WD40 repeat protein
MQVLRAGHTATLLSTGQVLVTGGNSATVTGFASAEIFDPITQKFTASGNMTTPRSGHTATLLCDLTAPPCRNDKVLITGGGADTSELFDPASGTFLPSGGGGQLLWHTATLLRNGKVLIAGGAGGVGAQASAGLYDPSTDTFTDTGNMTTGRWGHTATLLASGKVLIAGGYDSAGIGLTSAELYDPVTGTFSITGSMLATWYGHTATRLPDGRVLIVGRDATGTAPAELYDPASGKFAETGHLAVPRDGDHAAVLLPDGTVLVAGGHDLTYTLVLADAELYHPQTGTFSGTGGLQTARASQVMTALGKSGRVLVTGGAGPLTASVAAELYQ